MVTGLLIGGLGPGELLVIGAIVVLLFGASKIPELARSMGRAKGEYKKGVQEADEEIASLEDEDEAEPEDETTARA